MITPRSFLYTRRQHSPTSTTSTTITTITTTTPAAAAAAAAAAATAATVTPRRKDDTAKDTSSPYAFRLISETIMSRSKAVQSEKVLSPNRSPPSATMTNASLRANNNNNKNNSAGAVQIPVKSNYQDVAHVHKTRHHARRPRDAHSPDAIPPSVAALLAVTSIPPPSRRRSLRHRGSRESRESKDSRMTVDSIVPRSRVSEKDLSRELRLGWDRDQDQDQDQDISSLSSFERTPMDVLLSPPDELEDDEASIISDSGFASALSTRPGSFESLPSLADSSGTSVFASMDSPITPRGRRYRSPRRSLEPVRSPPGEVPQDPLSKKDFEVDRLDFRVFDSKPATEAEKQLTGLMPLKSVFKSNLTASLRALRSAARSLSTFTTSSIPPDDFLTRSILTMDPRVPFTDERRPPVLEEEPSEAMRRYLNPTSNLRPDSRTPAPIRSYTASIQMQTYKVRRSKGIPTNRPVPQPSSSNKAPAAVVFSPGPRQREMRENSDFIRIAVMEHLMRKHGKLDDQREGHARWLLPPRKATAKPYGIGADGVPLRWIAISLDDV
ncbi:hypothetical protein F4775DRAFT_14914 [Biscogniauxia sp. FL1348]|nr:hypothetical protein F4775DRAFT_14914 [Biscogniauxia sp. FL1348]